MQTKGSIQTWFGRYANQRKKREHRLKEFQTVFLNEWLFIGLLEPDLYQLPLHFVFAQYV